MQNFENLTHATEARAELRKELRATSDQIRLLKREGMWDDPQIDREARADARQKLFDAGQALEDRIAVVDAWLEERRAADHQARIVASRAHEVLTDELATRRQEARAEILRAEADRQAVAKAREGMPGDIGAEREAWHATIVAAVAREREACAQLAEQCSGGDALVSARYLIAQGIRARATIDKELVAPSDINPAGAVPRAVDAPFVYPPDSSRPPVEPARTGRPSSSPMERTLEAGALRDVPLDAPAHDLPRGASVCSFGDITWRPTR